jgi:hypothetical protein
MPATARRLSRRALLFGAAATLARAADPAQDAWEFVTGLAAALERSNASDFLRACDPAMPSYADLRANVAALVAQADAESAIDPVRNEGDDRSRNLEVDWSLHLTARSELLRATDRRSNVKLRIEKRGRVWKAVAIEPVAFFRPPSA